MKNLLIYYGWLNSFNSATNGWDNEKVAQELAQYDILVFGDGIASSSHGDYSNSSIIIPRVKTLNPEALIFGYSTINQTFSIFKSDVDDWATLDVHGIFLDEAGYDYGSASTNGREAFNVKVDYVHSKDMLCFANAWKPEHVLDITNDASYPNTTYNPNLIDSNLNADDWYLLESFGITSSAAYESKTQWASRGEKAQDYNINIAGSSVISDSDTSGDDKFKFISVSAHMWNLDAVGSSDINYGASSAASKMWERPAYGAIELFDNEPVNCNNDSDVYLKYGHGGKLKIDFSSSSEISTIEEY